MGSGISFGLLWKIGKREFGKLFSHRRESAGHGAEQQKRHER
jgi:hypothetical protein